MIKQHWHFIIIQSLVKTPELSWPNLPKNVEWSRRVVYQIWSRLLAKFYKVIDILSIENHTFSLDCQRGKIKFFTKAPKLETHKMPEFLDAKIVTEMAAEFKLEDNTDWMDTTDLATPTQGATVKILDDGFTELEALEEDDDEEIEEDGDEVEDMEGDEEGKLQYFFWLSLIYIF